MKLKKLISAAVSAAMLLGTLPVLQVSAGAASSNHTYKLYEAQTDRQDDIFQYHFAGGTDAFMSGASATGECYDAYLWVPPAVTPGSLRGLVAIKANLIEVPFVYSAKLKSALAEENFGILFIVCQKDSYRYNNTLCSFNTRKDYAGNTTSYSGNDFTTDGKDAADIMNDILSGIAEASGYSEIKDNTPLITIGHSAASPFGYRSGNWNKDRIIAQVHMKNGMWGDADTQYMIPSIPSLQYAAQYTEHAKNTGRDRSVCDARYHIDHQRAKDTNMLVSHIIEWGSGHYDWSDNATDMMVKYIQKAIDYRVPSGFTGGSAAYTLTDLTNTGYLMKPFEKDGTSERPVNYYKDTLKGWLSSGQNNSGASAADKKASYWFFDKAFADEVNAFTNYAIPPSPGTNDTKVAGATYSAIEPYMLMKNPALSTHANTPASAENEILPMTPFNADMSRYGSNRFVNYTRLANPSGNAANSANLQGYDTATVDTYYMTNIPQVTSNDNTTPAYDGAGNEAYVPASTKAEFVPLMAPYEIVSSELLNKSAMTDESNNSEAANVASVTRTTLRFHNNRVFYSAGNRYTSDYGTLLGSFGMIVSPEKKSGDTVTSAFKATAVEMNVPYTGKGSQTLTLNTIPNVNIKDTTAAKTFDVTYTSSDSDLQKYTDVFVEYGPARAVRTVEPDGSYSWKIEILKDQIPEGAAYPIPVNVVASNLGKWETVAGATASQVFCITNSDVELDKAAKVNYDEAVNAAAADDDPHTVTVYSDQTTAQRSNMDGSEKITFVNYGGAVEVKQTTNNMMFLSADGATSPALTFGKSALTSTDAATALKFNANNQNRFAELNKGSMTLYNGVIITGGKAARGGGIDCKAGSTLNMSGGIITGNTAVVDQYKLGGGGVSIVGNGVMNMSGGVITENTSEDNAGGGVSVMEDGSTLNMSGGTITGNTGYDVYVRSGKNTNLNMSGSAKIGSLYLGTGKAINVNGAFTTAGSHAEITPGAYTEGATLVTYANGLTPSTGDFTIAKDGETAWYTYVDGQNLKLTATAPHTITNGGNVTVQQKAAQGETVEVTLPDNYVANSLVVSGYNPSELTKISDKVYSFVMNNKAVTVSCLVNDDPNKVIIVGTNSSYYAGENNDVTVTFDVPALSGGYGYSHAEVRVPNSKSAENNRDVKILMNGEEKENSKATIAREFTPIKPGEKNTLTIKYVSANVDYYSYVGGYNGTRYDYPTTASDLSTLTLTKELTTYKIINDGNVTVPDTAKKGSTVNVTVPAGYVENSLVVYRNATNQTAIITPQYISDNKYSFTMPENDVTVSCLVNNDPSKVVVVGKPNTYYIRSDHSMNVAFDVPEFDIGYTYKSATIRVPVRANKENALNMKATINGNTYDTGADISLNNITVNEGVKNTLTITNEGGGVDYYSNSICYDGTYYAAYNTASNLPTLTLTKAVYAKTKAFTDDEAADADINKDAKGYYIQNLALPSWNPALKWVITFDDGNKASSEIKSFPKVTGGSANIGLVVYGTMANNEKTYTTSNIQLVAIVE